MCLRDYTCSENPVTWKVLWPGGFPDLFKRVSRYFTVTVLLVLMACQAAS